MTCGSVCSAQPPKRPKRNQRYNEETPMRRVVVTGIGIVSSICPGQDEVATSLKEARSGIQHAPDHAKYGFRSQVWAPPALGATAEDWTPLVDRRAARFLANGTAWGHIAFEEALKDSGIDPEDIKNDRT